MCGELWIRKRQPGDGGACLFPGRSGGTSRGWPLASAPGHVRGSNQDK